MAGSWLQPGAGNIAEGWGAPPKLDAPNISGVLGEILQQRRYQEALTQKNIADAVKQMRQQREEQAYLEAAQQAGLLPEGAEGMGGKYASELARQIAAQKVASAHADYYSAAADRARRPSAGGRGGGGGSVSDSGLEFVTDPKTGLRYQVNRTSKSVTYKLAPGQGGEKQIQPTRAERANAAPTIPGLTVYPDNTADPLPPDIAPEQEPLPAGVGADKAENLAPGYGVPPSGPPQPGEIRKGYRFKGGDPADQNNWEPV